MPIKINQYNYFNKKLEKNESRAIGNPYIIHFFPQQLYC